MPSGPVFACSVRTASTAMGRAFAKMASMAPSVSSALIPINTDLGVTKVSGTSAASSCSSAGIPAALQRGRSASLVLCAPLLGVYPHPRAFLKHVALKLQPTPDCGAPPQSFWGSRPGVILENLRF